MLEFDGGNGDEVGEGENHIDGPLGVRGRNSNNDVIREKLGWDYSMTLEEGISKTYAWIEAQANVPVAV